MGQVGRGELLTFWARMNDIFCLRERNKNFGERVNVLVKKGKRSDIV